MLGGRPGGQPHVECGRWLVFIFALISSHFPIFSDIILLLIKLLFYFLGPNLNEEEGPNTLINLGIFMKIKKSPNHEAQSC